MSRQKLIYFLVKSIPFDKTCLFLIKFVPFEKTSIHLTKPVPLVKTSIFSWLSFYLFCKTSISSWLKYLMTKKNHFLAKLLPFNKTYFLGTQLAQGNIGYIVSYQQ